MTRAAYVPRELQEITARLERLRERLCQGDPDMTADEIQAAIDRAEAKRQDLLDQQPAARESTIAETPAGHALTAWLDAFNSGDRERFESFERAHAAWLRTDAQMGLRARSAGYDLVSIDQGDKLGITFRLKERASSAEMVCSIVVRSNDLDHISLLSLEPPAPRLEKTALRRVCRNVGPARAG